MGLKIENINKSFEDFHVLDNINLDIEEGSFVSLLGASGSGKTTLLRLIAGLDRPDSGRISFNETIFFDSHNPMNLEPGDRNIGMVFQDFALWPNMNVYDNVAYPIKVKKSNIDMDQRVKQVLEDVQLLDFKDKPIHKLSGGQKQRVSLARALISDAKLILLDEPLSALDASLREEMRLLIKKLVKEYNMTAVFVTHDQYEAMIMSDKVALMKNGQILQYDSPENLYYYPVKNSVAEFIGQGTHLYGTIKGDEFRVDDNLLIQADFGGINGQYEWIIRPENVNIVNAGNNKVTIETVSFTGEKYEYTTSLNEHIIKFYSNKRLEEGYEVFLDFTKTENNLFKLEEL